MCRTPFVLSLLTLFLLLSIATLLAAIFGHAWWIDSSQQRGGTFKQGILRNCHYYITMPKNCMFRENFFGFKKRMPQDSNGDHLDVVLLLLTISVVSQMLATICSMSCTCASLTCATCSTKSCWNFGTLLSALFASIGAITSVGGMSYCEVKLDIKFATNSNIDENNWSYLLGWIGAAACVLSMFLSFLMIYMKPRPGYEATSTKHWSSKDNVMTSRNTAYQPNMEYTF